ncbi:hypothetical protein M0R88_04950 [Halorussus gelatinilyticus]|uniref:Uncharacterized protein n=1 Tax=Halorussus gelatinilyticus TaxID=2937524 RepID=A0A8U0IK43_9EURY|nr:DUF6653 family protein [Halorussus gelatinilyticus]UPW01453.1 hypothetical protein M0R88_04950 [Halorussus gelatinilyticus]
MASALRRRLADADFWERHEHPASGWSRVPTGPLLRYAVYARNWRLFAATVAFVAVNPVLFPEPGPGADDSWMTRGVCGERLWVQGADAGRAGLLNAVNVPVFCWAVYAAIRRRPARTALFTALSMALKLAFVNEMAKLYDREGARAEER